MATSTDDVYSREELEELYPLGTVGLQIDDVVTPFTEAEWNTWIESQVGQSKVPPR